MIGTIQILVRTHSAAEETRLKDAAGRADASLVCSTRETAYSIWRVSWTRQSFASPEQIGRFYNNLMNGV